MKILKVKKKSLDYNGNGTINLKFVMGKRFKNNKYTHVKVGSVVYNASVMSGLVWIDKPLVI